jgi:hypothetical protein
METTPTKDLEVAETLKGKFYGALGVLNEIANIIEKTDMPEQVLYRGRLFQKNKVIEAFDSAFALLDDAETYLHQHAKNQDMRSRSARS